MASEHLASTSQKAVVFLPGSNYDFGNVTEFTTASTNPDPYFTIRAQSSADDDIVESITLMPTCGSDFALDLQQQLPAEVYCMPGTTYALPQTGSGVSACTPVDYTFGARFTPTSAGSQSCDVQIVTMPKSAGSGSGSTTTYTVHLTGVGLATQYSMKVMPTTTLDYGDIALGSDSGNQAITVFNNGGAAIDVMASSTDAIDFVSSPGISGTFNLLPNASRTFQVHCHAGGTPATYSAIASFSTTSAQGSLGGSVQLACRAVATSVSVQPNPVDLGTHLLGDAPTTVPVVITNTGGTTVAIGSFSFSGTPGTEITYNPQPSSLNLGSGQNLTVHVQYAPTSERDTGPLGTMVFDVDGTPTNVPLRGGAHTGSIGTNPAGVDFGTICAGQGSAMDVTVFANAGGDVTVSDPTGPSSPFMAALPAGGRTLLAHHGTDIALTVSVNTTATTAAGDYTDSIGLGTDIPGHAHVPIGVHAAVLAGGIAPTPSMVHFGPNALDKPSPVQMVTLTNCGSGDLVITDASFTGANASEFAIVSPGDPHVTIQQTKSQQFLVLMTPQSAGPKSAQLVFTYASGTSTVALDGTGFGVGGDGGNKDRETYYACSIGGPGAALPIALAAAFAARRRRRRARA